MLEADKRRAIAEHLRAKGHGAGEIFMADLIEAFRLHGLAVVLEEPARSSRAYVDAPLRAHVGFMLEKLEANAHKGPWEALDAYWLHRQARIEMAELLEALEREDPVAIKREAADVSNFMVMIGDNAERHVQKREASA